MFGTNFFVLIERRLNAKSLEFTGFSDDSYTKSHFPNPSILFSELNTLGCFVCLVFQIFTLEFCEFQGQRSPIDGSFIATDDTDQPPRDVGHHGRANAGFQTSQSDFIVARTHIRDRDIQFSLQFGTGAVFVGVKDRENVTAVYQCFFNIGNETRQDGLDRPVLF